MATSVVGSSSSGNAADSTSRSTAVPAGTQAGDVAVCVLDRWFGTTANTAITFAGFTQVPGVVSNSDNASKTHVFYKRLIGTDSGSYSCSWTTNAFAQLRCVVLRGVLASGDPVVDSPSSTPLKSTSGVYGSIPALNLTADAGTGLVWAVYNDSTGTHTPATGFTELVDVDCAALAVAIAASTGVQTASGGSISSSSPAAALLVGFKPEPASGTTGTLDLAIGAVSLSMAATSEITGTATLALGAPSVSLAGQADAPGSLGIVLGAPALDLSGQADAVATLGLAISGPVLGVSGESASTAAMSLDIGSPALLIPINADATAVLGLAIGAVSLAMTGEAGDAPSGALVLAISGLSLSFQAQADAVGQMTLDPGRPDLGLNGDAAVQAVVDLQLPGVTLTLVESVPMATGWPPGVGPGDSRPALLVGVPQTAPAFLVGPPTPG